MSKKSSKVSGGLGLAIALVLALLQNAQKNTPPLALVLLIGTFASLVYWISQTSWVINPKKRMTKIVRKALATLAVAIAVVLLGIWTWPKAIPGSQQQVPTVLVRYRMVQLPIRIPPRSTCYVLQLNPKIEEGTYEVTNSETSDMWWPTKPPDKSSRPLDAVYSVSSAITGKKRCSMYL